MSEEAARVILIVAVGVGLLYLLLIWNERQKKKRKQKREDDIADDAIEGPSGDMVVRPRRRRDECGEPAPSTTQHDLDGTEADWD